MENKFEVLKISLKLKTPLHLGDFERGVFARTKRYIPEKNLWAALTSVITKDIMKEYSPELYRVIGAIVKERCKFSYFYLDDVNEERIYFPYYNNSGFQYLKCSYDLKKSETISAKEFDHRYIDSQIMTAIDHDKFSHKDESLHEEEFIYANNIAMTGFLYFKTANVALSELIKNKPAKDIALINKCYDDKGDLNFNQAQLKEWIKLLEYEGIGGHRKRGFGKIQVIINEVTEKETWFDEEIELGNVNQNDTLIKIVHFLKDINREFLNENSEINKYLLLTPVFEDQLEELVGKVSFYGDIKPLVGREWTERRDGAGQSITSQVAAVVGSTFSLISEAF